MFYSLCKILHLLFHFVFDMELASFPSSYPNNISSQHSIQQPKPELLSLFLGPPLIHLFIPSGPKKQKKKNLFKKKKQKKYRQPVYKFRKNSIVFLFMKIKVLSILFWQHLLPFLSYFFPETFALGV